MVTDPKLLCRGHGYLYALLTTIVNVENNNVLYMTTVWAVCSYSRQVHRTTYYVCDQECLAIQKATNLRTRELKTCSNTNEG